MSKSPKQQYLHVYSWAGYFAYPVEVLSKGKVYARARLLHETHIGRSRCPAGTIRTRVPLWSLSDHPSSVSYVSLGGGRFK